METPLRLMAVLAHSDDESLAMGGTIARYAEEGADVHLITATRGEPGRCDHLSPRPDDREVGQIREAELMRAAEILGVQSVTFLDCLDGALAAVDAREVTSRIAERIVHVRPNVVVPSPSTGR